MNEILIRRAIVVVSVLILLIVALLFYVNPVKSDLGMDLKFFPRFHAFLNTLTACCLLAAVYYIKKKNILFHKRLMLTAFVLSSVFLISYVFYHALSTPTKYGGEGLLKYVYYFILLTHVILAAGVLPFILFTFYRALNNQFEQHVKIARWTFPIWLYVAVSGVLVYLLISPYYV